LDAFSAAEVCGSDNITKQGTYPSFFEEAFHRRDTESAERTTAVAFLCPSALRR